MPGHGRAGKPERFSYPVDGYAGHLAALLDQLGITPRMSSRTTSEARGP